MGTKQPAPEAAPPAATATNGVLAVRLLRKQSPGPACRHAKGRGTHGSLLKVNPCLGVLDQPDGLYTEGARASEGLRACGT